jgi:hypothetical protein
MDKKKEKPNNKPLEVRLAKVYKTLEANEVKLKEYLTTVKPSKA